MRKNHIFKKGLFFVMVVLVALSCQDTDIDRLFNKPYTERIQEEIKELRTDLMASEHGWKTVYITDKENLGGFNFLFRFTDENNVEMASDFSREDTVFRSSEYTIKDASTLKLSFTTANVIHKLSDSGNSPISGELGSGYKGDFEFLYHGKEEEELIFRGNKTNGNLEDHVEFRLVKAGASALDDLQEAYKSRVKINPILSGAGAVSPHRAISILSNGDVKAKFAYDYNARLAFLTAEDSIQSFSSPIYFTPKGFVVSKIGVVDTYTNVEFFYENYDATEDQFTAIVSEDTIVMGSSTRSVIPGNDHKNIIDPTIISQLGYFHKDSDLPSGLTTPSFEVLYEVARGIRFTFLNDFLSRGGDKLDFFWIETSDGIVVPFCNYDVQSDRIVFIKDGYDPRREPTTDGQRALVNFLFDSEGFYVENLGRVTRFANHIYTLTSVKDPSVRVAFYAVSPQ